MTRDSFTNSLPRFAGTDIEIKPPFVYRGVSARIFPLRASLDILQQLCDQYINIVPPQAGYFRAPIPYAYLVVLDYGQMGEAEMRAGWFSQVEVFFGVPLEWYKFVGGQWVFHDWALITPYIFVDDDVSAPVGRTVFGYPKILSRVQQIKSRWIRKPVTPVTLARIETKVFPKAYTGGNLEERVFLEIERETVSHFQTPFNAESPVWPWTIASNMAEAFGGFCRDAMWLAQTMRIFPVNPFAEPHPFPEMILGHAPRWFAPGGNGFIINSLNLKQFRHESCPRHICFQALTNGPLRPTAFTGSGLLGEGHILLGDLSGGYSIRLYEHSSLPIARTLGLEAHQTWRADGIQVDEFRPVMPFWLEGDLEFDRGTNVAFRTDNGIWKDETGQMFPPAQQPARKDGAPEFNNTVSTAIEAIAGPFQYTGATIRVLPLLANKENLEKFLDSNINKPLRDPTSDEYGNTKYVQLSLWAPEEVKETAPAQEVTGSAPAQEIKGRAAYVYLTVSSFADVTSESNNVGDWAKFELAFMIPVKLKRWIGVEPPQPTSAKGKYRNCDEPQNPNGPWDLRDGRWETAGVGVVPAFTVADNLITAISRVEIQGIAATTANFVRGESAWLSQEGDLDATQNLLRVDAEVLPVLGAGQEAAFHPVIKISRAGPDAGLDNPYTWAGDLKRELVRKNKIRTQSSAEFRNARSLALELLANQAPFALYTLKQFRDIADPDKACHQSLVRVSRALLPRLWAREKCHQWDPASPGYTETGLDIREMEHTLAVRIYDYPVVKIVEDLGIRAARLEERAAGIVYCAQAIRPFYIRATIDEPLAERLLSRSETPRQWKLTGNAFRSLLSEQDGSPRITADRFAGELQDDGDPRAMSAVMYHAEARRDYGEDRDLHPEITKADAQKEITKADAQKALDRIDPQMVIESILSREWGNFDENARWRQGRRRLFDLAEMLALCGSNKAEAESLLFRSENNKMASRPGAVASMVALDGQPVDPNSKWQQMMEEIITSQKEFTQARTEMEDSINALAPVTILASQGIRITTGMDASRQKELRRNIVTLVKSLREIGKHAVKGKPSPENNLDPRAADDFSRLDELLNLLDASMPEPGVPTPVYLEQALAHVDGFYKMVELARSCCDVQFQALLNKLSRAYQKPDFCIRRSAAGTLRDTLLPISESWDNEWYCGEEWHPRVRLRKSSKLTKYRARDEKR